MLRFCLHLKCLRSLKVISQDFPTKLPNNEPTGQRNLPAIKFLLCLSTHPFILFLDLSSDDTTLFYIYLFLLKHFNILVVFNFIGAITKHWRGFLYRIRINRLFLWYYCHKLTKSYNHARWFNRISSPEMRLDGIYV